MEKMNQVIGNGLLARSVANLPACISPVCYFASGVSNSTCCDPVEFGRERNLLHKTIDELSPDTILVYFSTCSIYETPRSRSMYVTHKLEMEDLISRRGRSIIFRLPQVVGYTNNKFTLINFLANSIKENRLIHVRRRAVRNIIDVDDVALLAMLIINSGKCFNSIVNIANPKSTSIIELIEILEKILLIKANCDFSDSGTAYPINTDIVQQIASANRIDFGDGYVERVLSKYYS